MWWVYVIQSEEERFNKKGKKLPGFYYVGCTTDPVRRLRQHNGEIKGGGKYTSKHRPWVARALHGPYKNRSEAQKAERALKKLRGPHRIKWSTADSEWCCGPGTDAYWVKTAGKELWRKSLT